MPRRKRTPVATRHGATQPETSRKARQVMLRLSPVVADILRDQSEHQDIPMSTLVAHLVLRTWGDQYEEGPDALRELTTPPRRA